MERKEPFSTGRETGDESQESDLKAQFKVKIYREDNEKPQEDLRRGVIILPAAERHIWRRTTLEAGQPDKQLMHLGSETGKKNQKVRSDG